MEVGGGKILNLEALTSIRIIRDKILSLVNTDLTTLNNIVSFGSAKVIDIEHYKIHEGSSFMCNHYSASFANNTYLDLRLTTTTKQVHLMCSFNAGGACAGSLTEIATTTLGTPVTIYNLNRNSGTVSTVTAVTQPTVSNEGTVIFKTYLPGGAAAAPTTVGAGANSRVEVILKTDTVYLVRLQNISGSARSGVVNLSWYEI
jgi:hypothetical protein